MLATIIGERTDVEDQNMLVSVPAAVNPIISQLPEMQATRRQQDFGLALPSQKHSRYTQGRGSPTHDASPPDGLPTPLLGALQACTKHWRHLRIKEGQLITYWL